MNVKIKANKFSISTRSGEQGDPADAPYGAMSQLLRVLQDAMRDYDLYRVHLQRKLAKRDNHDAPGAA